MASYLDQQNIYVPLGGQKTSGVTTAATATLTADDGGKVIIGTLGSGTQTFTLPTVVGNTGLRFTFICGHASGEILINPQTGEKIFGKTHGAENGTGIANTTTGIKNTAATNVVGDLCELVSDGVDTWWMKAVAGVWATQ